MRALGVMSLLVAGASAGIVLSDHSTIDRIGRKLGVGAFYDGAHAQTASRDMTADSGRWRLFSPQSPLIAPKEATVPATGPLPVAARPAPAAVGDSMIETATIQHRGPAQVIAPVPVQVSRNSMRPSDDASRANLAREIQAELRRVGCYDGNIDGDWGPAAKRAMKSFTDRVNAVLPMEQPDYILLTLVKGHLNKACGAGCAPGEIVAEGGRCIAKAVIAQPVRKRDANPAAGVKAESPALAQTNAGSWSATVAPRPAVTPQSAPAPLIVTERPQPVAPALPGRMAVGGPAGADVTAPSSIGSAAPLTAAADGAAAQTAEVPPLGSLAPAPAKRKAASNGGRQYRDTSNYERTFKNPQVVREFFFGRNGG